MTAGVGPAKVGKEGQVTEAENAPDPSARALLRQKDGEVRIIAAEMAEFAGRVNVLWGLAVGAIDSHPDTALSRLMELMILLEIQIPNETKDILAAVREASERLDAELPDDDEDQPTLSGPSRPDQLGGSDR